MSLAILTDSLPLVLSNNSKILALEKTLHQGVQDFKELLIDFEQLHNECANYKTQFINQKEKCDSNSCSSAELLKNVIESKNNIIESKNTIIESVASALIRINETKDLKTLDEVFKILCGDTPKPVLCYQDNIKSKENQMTSSINVKEESNSNEEVSFRDESVSEIEGTPTGRTSPIISSKRLKSSVIVSDFRDKKKCSGTWFTPDKKVLQSCTTPIRGKKNGRLRQSRLNVVTVNENNIIDITCSPEFTGGCRTRSEKDVQPIIKKESLDNDDTILPSPTSGPTNFTLFKSKDSPIKFKKPQLSRKPKSENKTLNNLEQSTNKAVVKCEPNSEKYCDVNFNHSVTFTQDDSINILNPNRVPNNLLKRSPVKQERCNDETFCETQSSISLLQHVNKLEDIHKDDKNCSPTKIPLAENINVTNMADDDDIQPSMSVLKRELKVSKMAADNVKRQIPEIVEMVLYNEPTVRRKAEKRKLPGWSCDKCREFFGELYKDDPEMMAKKINECSHHRGTYNPTDRPKTPPGFWNPRWKVPEDTEEFNRQNNVV